MKKFAIGIDLGGTYTKLALVSPKGKIVERGRLSTVSHKGRDRLIGAIIAEIGSILDRAGVSPKGLSGIGIGVPGLVDFEKGLVHKLTNVPGWDNTPLKGILEKKTGVRVLVDNDVNVMALGECRYGAGRGVRNAVCVTMGTGVGGGILIEGSLYRGESFTAGEIGHMPLNEKGPLCNCGRYACLERYVGNRYISEAMIAMIRSGRRSKVKDMAGGDLSCITPEIISRAARKGDAAAISLWEDIGTKIGTVLAGVVNLLNPGKVIIGGGVAGAGIHLFGPIRRTVAKRALRVPGKTVKIVRAKLGNDAGVIGAAALFF